MLENETPVPPAHREIGPLVLLFFVCFFMVICSGRLGFADAYSQLQAAMVPACTGRLGLVDVSRLGRWEWYWIPSPGGLYFQAHDIGNLILMLPAALVTRLVSDQPPSALIAAPPIIGRVGASFTISVLAATGCYFVYRFFRVYAGPRASFLLSLGYALATPYVAYSRIAGDVLGCCVGCCFLLWQTAVALRPEASRIRGPIGMGLGIASAVLFRYSLAPFLVVSVLVLAVLARDRLGWKRAVLCLATAFLGTAPTFWYNQIRTGSPLVTSLRVPRYLIQNGLDGNLTAGLYGLLISPNNGLLVFSPLLVLAFVGWIARRPPDPSFRAIVGSYGAGSALYILMIAKKTVWLSPCLWGPRYLVPVLPFFFAAAGGVLLRYWDRYRAWLVVLLALSVLNNLPTTVVNYQWALDVDPEASNKDSPLPSQQIAVWRSLVLRLAGHDLPAPREYQQNPLDPDNMIRLKLGNMVPDFWTARLMTTSRVGLAAGLTALGVLLGLSAWSLTRIVVGTRIRDLGSSTRVAKAP